MFGANPYIYGPHWFNADLSVNKSIPIKESVRATFQAQLLDVFNHPIFGFPSTLSAQSLSFSQQTALLTTTSYRRIELRLNIEF